MFWKHKSVASPSWVNHSRYQREAVFKCLFLDIESESLQFYNASIYVQFSVTFIMFFDIFFNYEGFSVTEKSGKLGKVWKRQYFDWNRSQFSKTLMLSFLENSVNKNKRNQQKIKGRFLKCSPTMWVFILKHDVCTSLTSRIIIIFFIPLVSDLPEIEECFH